MAYVVMATISGRRIPSKIFNSRAEAQAYADATNRNRPGANARVKRI